MKLEYVEKTIKCGLLLSLISIHSKQTFQQISLSIEIHFVSQLLRRKIISHTQQNYYVPIKIVKEKITLQYNLY